MTSLIKVCHHFFSKPLHNRWTYVMRRSMTSTSVVNEPVIRPPAASIDDKQYPQKIVKIVDEISSLTLLEVSELNQLLKKTLNISDTPMMSFGALPMGAPVAAQEEEEEEMAGKAVQTSFTLKLNKFDDSKKVALIKEIKTLIEGMNLVQAKKFVESVPQIIKSNLAKDEADKLKTALEAVGGQCVIE
ncbi:39S ribosomal protein L12, mitochondrial-like [Oppia nitens]|uniref:39S ribosomal protein L12, mitochondrial-like n=1 Tax=Oppia nitens TaxID=1686743 RepID=UPI0023DB5D90|nr:39S ribosomal protein L12, mitochondrial-like [Oppia nitens]